MIYDYSVAQFSDVRDAYENFEDAIERGQMGRARRYAAAIRGISREASSSVSSYAKVVLYSVEGEIEEAQELLSAVAAL